VITSQLMRWITIFTFIISLVKYQLIHRCTVIFTVRMLRCCIMFRRLLLRQLHEEPMKRPLAHWPHLPFKRKVDLPVQPCSTMIP
jgi:hypothetical protein